MIPIRGISDTNSETDPSVAPTTAALLRMTSTGGATGGRNGGTWLQADAPGTAVGLQDLVSQGAGAGAVATVCHPAPS